MTRLSRLRRERQRGQALVEFALSMLLLLLLVGGAAQIGVIYYTLLSVDSAARESARVASENPGNTGVTPNVTGAQPCTPLGGDTRLACKAAVNSTHNGVFGGLVDPTQLDVNLSWASFAGSTAKSCPGGVGTSDGVVTVAVSYNAPIFLPIVGPIFATGTNPYRTVTGTEIIRVEPCNTTFGG
jgi:Flp pilus assembly protein TadG